MKIYKVSVDRIFFPRIGIYTLSNGVEIPAIVFGEYGRGRELVVVPVKGVRLEEVREKDLYLVEVEPTQTRSGKLAFRAKEITEREPEYIPAPAEDERFFMIIYPGFGFRGWGSVKYENDEGVKILEEGYHAQGAAGRMGGAPEYLVELSLKNLPIYLRRGGRLYGSPGVHVVFEENGKLFVLPKDEYDLLD